MHAIMLAHAWVLSWYDAYRRTLHLQFLLCSKTTAVVVVEWPHVCACVDNIVQQRTTTLVWCVGLRMCDAYTLALYIAGYGLDCVWETEDQIQGRVGGWRECSRCGCCSTHAVLRVLWLGIAVVVAVGTPAVCLAIRNLTPLDACNRVRHGVMHTYDRGPHNARWWPGV